MMSISKKNSKINFNLTLRLFQLVKLYLIPIATICRQHPFLIRFFRNIFKASWWIWLFLYNKSVVLTFGFFIEHFSRFVSHSFLLFLKFKWRRYSKSWRKKYQMEEDYFNLPDWLISGLKQKVQNESLHLTKLLTRLKRTF